MSGDSKEETGGMHCGGERRVGALLKACYDSHKRHGALYTKSEDAHSDIHQSSDESTCHHEPQCRDLRQKTKCEMHPFDSINRISAAGFLKSFYAKYQIKYIQETGVFKFSFFLITSNISSYLKNTAFLLTSFSTFHPPAVTIMRRHAVPDLSSAVL